VATIQPKRIFKIVETFAGRLIPAIREPAIGLQEHGRPRKPIAIPPMARASRRTAEAEDAFVGAVELAAIFGRLKPFPFGLGVVV